MNHLISIIIPVYNVEKEVSRCLDSVLEQTYDNIEIIAVDDGSSDGSGAILDQYSVNYPKKVRVFHKPNGGVTSARLFGVEKSTGEWIGFVDGDDVIEKDMYEFLLANAIKHKVQISHCGYRMVFEDGRVNYFHNTGCSFKQDTKRGIMDLLDGSKVEPGLCNKLFLRSLFADLLQTEVIPKEIKINEDLLMNFYLFSKSEISFFDDKCKYYYIVRGNSASRKKLNRNKIYDPIKVKQIILDNIDEELIDEAKRAYMSTCVNVYNSLALEKQKDFAMEKKYVRGLLKEHKNWSKLLSHRQQFLMQMILYIPAIYPYAYGFYARYIMSTPYN